jgi:hypothetical protein
MRGVVRDAVAVAGWSLFWVLVVLGALALVWEWRHVGPVIGL